MFSYLTSSKWYESIQTQNMWIHVEKKKRDKCLRSILSVCCTSIFFLVCKKIQKIGGEIFYIYEPFIETLVM